MVAVTKTATQGHTWFLVRLGTTGAVGSGNAQYQQPL